MRVSDRENIARCSAERSRGGAARSVTGAETSARFFSVGRFRMRQVIKNIPTFHVASASRVSRRRVRSRSFARAAIPSSTRLALLPSSLRGASSARRRRVSLERARRRAPAGVADGEHDDRREREKRERRERRPRDPRENRGGSAKTFRDERARKSVDRVSTAGIGATFDFFPIRSGDSVAPPRPAVKEKRRVVREARRGGARVPTPRAFFPRRESRLFVRLRRQRGGEPPEDFARRRGERIPPRASRARDPERHAAPRLVREPELGQARRRGHRGVGLVDGEKVRRKTHPTRLRERERAVVPGAWCLDRRRARVDRARGR